MAKVILQDEVSECGLACIAMIVNDFGGKLSLHDLRHKYRVSTDGLSLYQVVKILNDFNIDSTPLSGEYHQIKDLSFPSILFWNKSHFVIVESATDSTITILDPAIGRKTYQTEEVKYYFSGIALEIDKNSVLKMPEINADKRLSRNKEFFSVKGLALHSPWLARNLVLAFFLTLSIHLLSLAMPKLFSLTIDEVVAKNDEELMYLIVYIFGLIFVLLTAFKYIRTKLDFTIRRVVEQDLSSSFVQFLATLPLSFFENRNSASILRKTQALDKLYARFTAGWVDMAGDIIFACIFLVLMAMVNSMLALYSFMLCSLFIAYRLYTVMKLERLQLESIDKEIERNAVLISMVDEMKISKLYGNSSTKAAEWSAFQSKSVDARANVGMIQQMNTVVYTGVSNMQSLTISVLGAIAILKGDNSIGDLFSFFLYKDLFLDSILKVIDKYMNLRIVKVELDKLDDTLITEPEILASDNIDSLMLEGSGHIEQIVLENVSYCYGSFEDNVLEQINFKIEKGEHLAICGKSGGGKSTLLKILASLYQPTEGMVKVNGRAIEKFGLQNYRNKISFVGAGNEIVSGSVLDNITMHSTNADKDDVINSAKLAGIYEAITKLPAGFNTRIGAGGISLSSGQIQRVLIARALYRNPDLLILDEPTSHLDPESKEIILKSLENLPCAIILVTHDMSAGEYMHKTLTVINGRLVEDNDAQNSL